MSVELHTNDRRGNLVHVRGREWSLDCLMCAKEREMWGSNNFYKLIILTSSFHSFDIAPWPSSHCCLGLDLEVVNGLWLQVWHSHFQRWTINRFHSPVLLWKAASLLIFEVLQTFNSINAFFFAVGCIFQEKQIGCSHSSYPLFWAKSFYNAACSILVISYIIGSAIWLSNFFTPKAFPENLRIPNFE